MKALRTLATAATIAIATALSGGAASAETNDASVAPAYYPGDYGFGYGRLCYVPFHRLAQYYGFWQARMIKRSCFGGYYYNNY